jgi:hypothetical protein
MLSLMVGLMLGVLALPGIARAVGVASGPDDTEPVLSFLFNLRVLSLDEAAALLVASMPMAVAAILVMVVGLALPDAVLRPVLLRGRGRPVGPMARLLVCVGLSFGAAIAAGFALGLGSDSVDARSWPMLLGSMSAMVGAASALLGGLSVLVGVIVESARRSAQPPGPYVRPSRRRVIWQTTLGVVLLLLSAGITAGAVGTARADSSAYEHAEVVQLWMVPGPPAETQSLTIGVRNTHPSGQAYDVRVQTGDEEIASWPVVLPADGVWQATIPMPAAGTERLVTTLSRPGDDGAPIRRVRTRSDDGSC